MRKTNYTTVTFRVSNTVAKTLKKLPHGTRGLVVESLVTTHPETITKTVRRHLTQKAA